MEHWHQNKRVFFFSLILPVFWLFFFFFIPLSFVWMYSFGVKTGITGIAVTGTLHNYARALGPLYLHILWKSLWISFISTIITFLVAFPIAVMIAFSKGWWRFCLLIIVVLPFWMNMLVRTYSLIIILRYNGYLNYFLEFLFKIGDNFFTFFGLSHHQIVPIFHPISILYQNSAVILGLVYTSLPFMVFPLYASLEKIDHSYIEASLDLGANQLRTFFNIIIPLIGPGIAAGFIITFIPNFGSYLIPDLLGGASSEMIANVISDQFKNANDWPMGSALSFVLIYGTFFIIMMRNVLPKLAQRCKLAR